jgi:hypothetical protein
MAPYDLGEPTQIGARYESASGLDTRRRMSKECRHVDSTSRPTNRTPGGSTPPCDRVAPREGGVARVSVGDVGIKAGSLRCSQLHRSTRYVGFHGHGPWGTGDPPDPSRVGGIGSQKETSNQSGTVSDRDLKDLMSAVMP